MNMTAISFPLSCNDKANGFRHAGDHPDVDEVMQSHKNGLTDNDWMNTQELHFSDGRVLNYQPQSYKITGMYSIGPADPAHPDYKYVQRTNV